MTKLGATWLVLVSFFTQVAVAGTPPPTLEQALDQAVKKIETFKSLSQLKDPVIKLLVAKNKHAKSFQVPKVVREGNKLVIAAGKKTHSLEIVDGPDRKILINGNAVHLKSLDPKAIFPMVELALKKAHASLLDHLVPDAQAGDDPMEDLEMIACGFIIVAAILTVATLLGAHYMMNQPAPRNAAVVPVIPGLPF